MGESESRKAADVEANAFKPLRTGVYMSEPTEVMVGVCGGVCRRPSISWVSSSLRLRFRA